MPPTPAINVVFLDRDGVINRDSPEYIKSWAEFEFLPGSLDAIRLLSQNGFSIIIITNQSAIGRGMVPRETLEDMHRRMRLAIEARGGKIDAIFFCPHTPDDDCGCRKPKPGLILRAAKTLNLDPRRAVMIGDSAKDIQCARNAGCNTAVLVRTGNGRQAETELKKRLMPPDHIADDLNAAVRWILGCAGHRTPRSAP